MTTIRRGALELELPDNVSIAEEQARPRRRGGSADVGPTDPVSPEAVAAAFGEQLTAVDTVPLQVGPASPARRGSQAAPAMLRVDVGADEQAVLLVEQDGYYTWVTGTKELPRTGRRGPSATVVTFEIPYTPAPVAGSGRRGPIADLLVKPLTTIVFRFLARLAIGQVVKRMERSIEPRLVTIDGADPTSWTTPPAPQARPGRRLSLLLLIHGTFSSTRGGFGTLFVSEAGKALLEAAGKHYNQIIGFDHRTLSEDPLENAEQLLGLLRGLNAPAGIDIDVVTHSRGALVVRSLIEHLLGPEDDVTVTKAIMVAGPNAGTLLARPDNWSALIDLYTNLAIAACRVVAFAAPPAATVTTILKESLQAVAILVKAIVTEAADEVRVPGLGAMVPGGAFITALNVGAQPSQPIPAAYYSVSSNFEIGPVAAPASLPAKLSSRLADGLVDRLMGEANDLVVNVASMTAVDSPDLIRGSFALKDNPRTHHCAYFVEPSVVAALHDWLMGSSGPKGPPDTSPPIGETVYTLPTTVDTDFVVIDADTPLGVAKRQVRSSDRNFAVVRSLNVSGELEHYAFTPDEFMSLSDGVATETMAGPTGMLAGTLSSPVTRSIHAIPFQETNVETPWTSRTVVLLDGTPIGVADEASEAADPSPTRRGRGGLSPTTVAVPTTPSEAPSMAQAYFRAETDAVVSTESESLVLVDISLEALADASGAGLGADIADIQTDKPITVHVVPRINLIVNGDKHATVDPPTAGDPRSLRFTIIGARPGPGQLLVIAGQGPVDLVKIVLDVTVADDASVVPVPVSVTAALPPMPDVTATDRLIIDENTIVALAPGEPQTETVVQTRFDVRYESEALDVVVRDQTAPIKGDRLAYVTDLYRQIEADWGSSNADAKRFNRALRAFGGQLFDELLPESIQRQLWDNRDKIKHIQVNSIDPLIPWEIVHLKGPGQTLPSEELFLANLGLVRWIDGARYAPREVTVTRGRASAIAPAYPPESGWHLPETGAELDYLKTTFSATEVATDVEAVLSLIERPGQFDLLHFAGHGEAAVNDISNAGLILQVRKEGGGWAPIHLTSTMVEQFANLRDGNGNRPLVFLNACQAGLAGHQLTQVGGFAQAFLKGGAGIFVSTLWSVMDTPARRFGEEFYTQLIAGKTVAQAAVAARRATHAADDPTWLAYVVYGRPDGRLVFS